MSDPFLGETRIFAFPFPPAGWAACAGQLLPVNEFAQLFQLIGTTYGGDGESTFALPNATGPESEGTALGICISLFGDVPSG
jgi:microcystin-dependent protein